MKPLPFHETPESSLAMEELLVMPFKQMLLGEHEWAPCTLVRSVLSLTVLYVRQTIHHSQLSWSLISCTVTATMCTYCPDPFHLLHRAHVQQHMTMLLMFMHCMDCIMGCEYLVPATNTILIQYNCGFVTNTEHLQKKKTLNFIVILCHVDGSGGRS